MTCCLKCSGSAWLQMHCRQDCSSLGSVSISLVIYGIIHFIIVGKVSFPARQDVHMQMGDRLTSSRAVLQSTCHQVCESQCSESACMLA